MNEKTKDMLFHYTNAAGLKGILEEGTLRATAYYTTNDSSELTYSKSVIKKAFKKELDDKFVSTSITCSESEANLLAQISILAEEMNNEFFRVMEIFTQSLQLEAYITCFTMTEEDSEISNHGLLSQWRGYGGDGGYSIGFDLDGVRNVLHRDFSDRKIIYGSVNYGETGDNINKLREKYIKPWIDELVDIQNITAKQKKFPLFTSINGYGNRSEVTELKESVKEKIVALLDDYFSVVLLQKNPHFDEEKEFRICVLKGSDGKVHHFTRDDTIVPFLKNEDIKLNQCINTVIIGPCARSKARARSVSSLLQYNNIDKGKVKIKISEIPYDRG